MISFNSPVTNQVPLRSLPKQEACAILKDLFLEHVKNTQADMYDDFVNYFNKPRNCSLDRLKQKITKQLCKKNYFIQYYSFERLQNLLSPAEGYQSHPELKTILDVASIYFKERESHEESLKKVDQDDRLIRLAAIATLTEVINTVSPTPQTVFFDRMEADKTTQYYIGIIKKFLQHFDVSFIKEKTSQIAGGRFICSEILEERAAKNQESWRWFNNLD